MFYYFVRQWLIILKCIIQNNLFIFLTKRSSHESLMVAMTLELASTQESLSTERILSQQRYKDVCKEILSLRLARKHELCDRFHANIVFPVYELWPFFAPILCYDWIAWTLCLFCANHLVKELFFWNIEDIHCAFP